MHVLIYNFEKGHWTHCHFYEHNHAISMLVKNDDVYGIYNIDHWTSQDIDDFSELDSGHQLGIMENLEVVMEPVIGKAK